MIEDVTVLDSAHIYLISHNNFMVYDGNIFTEYPINFNEFGASTICAVNENCVYIGGFNTNPNSGYYARLLKWDGSMLSEINVMAGSKIISGIVRMYAFSETEIWMSGNNGMVLKFDGNAFEYYELDSGYNIFPFFKTGGQVYCAGQKSINDSNYTYFENFLNIYRLDNSKGHIIYSDSSNTFTESYPSPRQNLIDGKMYGRTPTGIYEFIGNGFNLVLTNNELYFGFAMAGKSNSNILINCVFLPNESFGIFHWNGSKWSAELVGSQSPDFVNNILSFEDKYLVLAESLYGTNLLYIGNPKF